jgi:hypothetical protein
MLGFVTARGAQLHGDLNIRLLTCGTCLQQIFTLRIVVGRVFVDRIFEQNSLQELVGTDSMALTPYQNMPGA